MSLSAAFGRVVVLGRAAPLRRTVRVLPRAALALRNGSETAARPLSISALMRAAKATATKTSTKTKAKKSPAAKKKTATGKKSTSKAKAGAKKPKAAAKKAVKKKTTKKAVKKVAKKAPKKKVLTPEQKDKRELLKLKQMALLKAPRQLPSTAWTVFVSKNVHKGDGVGIKNMPSIASSFRSLSDSEKQNYQQIANTNKDSNAKAYRDWVASYPVEVVYMANLARRRLGKKLDKNKVYLIHDDRQPHRALTAYTLFFKDTYAKTEGISTTEAFKEVSEKWHSLSEGEKAPYLKQASATAEKSQVLLKELKQKANAYWKEQVAEKV